MNSSTTRQLANTELANTIHLSHVSWIVPSSAVTVSSSDLSSLTEDATLNVEIEMRSVFGSSNTSISANASLIIEVRRGITASLFLWLLYVYSDAMFLSNPK